MSSDNFYVGWQDDMPPSTKKFMKKLLLFIGLITVSIVVLIVVFQKHFNNHVFEFGNTTELTGVYIAKPYPMLQLTHNSAVLNSESVLLVGFGKFGAESIMQDIQNKEGSLDLKEITLAGTLIYGDGVALLELTNKAQSYVNRSGNFRQPLVTDKKSELITLTGEILDPKCYFGVMKPGEGKIHKSCAIRCLSGGIPPVFRVQDVDANTFRYYLLSGNDGTYINQELLPLVGQVVTLQGIPYSHLDWTLLEIDPKLNTQVSGKNE
ncbi:MAG: hypothetical protein NXI08_04215 [bacterium]|nr:hypothetical protein [bacterium]